MKLVEHDRGGSRRDRLGQHHRCFGLNRIVGRASLQVLPGADLDAMLLQRFEQETNDLHAAVAVQFHPGAGLHSLDGEDGLIRRLVAEMAKPETASWRRQTPARHWSPEFLYDLPRLRSAHGQRRNGAGQPGSDRRRRWSRPRPSAAMRTPSSVISGQRIARRSTASRSIGASPPVRKIHGSAALEARSRAIDVLIAPDVPW